MYGGAKLEPGDPLPSTTKSLQVVTNTMMRVVNHGKPYLRMGIRKTMFKLRSFECKSTGNQIQIIENLDGNPHRSLPIERNSNFKLQQKHFKVPYCNVVEEQ